MACSSTWLTDGSGSRESDTLALSVYLTQQKNAKLKHCNIALGLKGHSCNCYTVLGLHLFLEGILPGGPVLESLKQSGSLLSGPALPSSLAAGNLSRAGVQRYIAAQKPR